MSRLFVCGNWQLISSRLKNLSLKKLKVECNILCTPHSSILHDGRDEKETRAAAALLLHGSQEAIGGMGDNEDKSESRSSFSRVYS